MTELYRRSLDVGKDASDLKATILEVALVLEALAGKLRDAVNTAREGDS
jgi:hypothetical protein